MALPADWGPNEKTGRVADLSPGLMEALGIDTDDEVEVSSRMRTTSYETGTSALITLIVAIALGLGLLSITEDRGISRCRNCSRRLMIRNYFVWMAGG